MWGVGMRGYSQACYLRGKRVVRSGWADVDVRIEGDLLTFAVKGNEGVCEGICGEIDDYLLCCAEVEYSEGIEKPWGR